MGTLFILTNDVGIPMTVDGKAVYFVEDNGKRFEFTTKMKEASRFTPERAANVADLIYRSIDVVWFELDDIPEEVMQRDSAED